MDLDGVKCMGEIDFGDLQFDNLEAVTLSRANLTSLKNFPTLPNLVKVRLEEPILRGQIYRSILGVELTHTHQFLWMGVWIHYPQMDDH